MSDLENEKEWRQEILRELRAIKREAREDRKQARDELAGLTIDIGKIKEQLASLRVKTGLVGLMSGAVAGFAPAGIRQLLGK